MRPSADERRALRAGRRGRPVHPDAGGPGDLVNGALSVRLGYLLGCPDLTAADVGASVLEPLAPGPATRRAFHRTVAGFLSEHAGRASRLAPGRVLGAREEAGLAADAVRLALLCEAAEDRPLAATALAAPVRAGLDDQRFEALVDPRVVADVVRLTGAAERTLWRPLATSRTARVDAATWRLGDVLVRVDLAERGRAATPAQGPTGDDPAVWFGRYERLVRLPGAGTTRGAHDRVGRR